MKSRNCGSIRGLTLLCIGIGLTFASRAGSQPACKRPPARAFQAGETIVLKESESLPCVLQIAQTSVELRAGTSSSPDEIGAFVSRGPDGKFYTSADAAGKVSVWNANGSFSRSIGRVGQGPGEFAAGPKFIKFDASGRMYVGDNSPRWAIYSNTLQYVGAVSARDFGIGLHNCCAVLDDGTLLSSYGRTNGAFRIIDFNRRNGAAAPETRAFGPSVSVFGSTRPVAYASGNQFWAGGATRVPFEYALELWRTDGTRLRTIRREVSWLPAKSDLAQLTAELQPIMQLLHDDGTGLLFVSVMVPSKAWSSLTPVERRDTRPGSARDRAIRNYFEVIDANAGVLIASSGPFAPSEVPSKLPAGFFRQSRQGYQRIEDADGFPRMRIVEARLISK